MSSTELLWRDTFENNEFWDECRRFLVPVARKLVYSVHVAEDLVQSTMLDLARGVASIPDNYFGEPIEFTARVKSFLRLVLGRRLADMLRRKYKIRLDYEGVEKLASNEDSPEYSAAIKDVVEVLRQKHPDDVRALSEALDHPEGQRGVAADSGASYNAIRQRTTRARKNLRQAARDLFPD